MELQAIDLCEEARSVQESVDRKMFKILDSEKDCDETLHFCDADRILEVKEEMARLKDMFKQCSNSLPSFKCSNTLHLFKFSANYLPGLHVKLFEPCPAVKIVCADIK